MLNLRERVILIQRPVSMVLDADEFQTAWQDSDFISDCLCWHNVYRQRHGAQPLTMSPELCDYAQTWANHLAHTNTFYYRNDRDVGQNLFCRPANALQTDVSGQEVSSYWYSAVRQYDYGKEPDVLHANVNAGHFTQLVWANSQYFGIGKARSRSGKVLVVANYSPPGNISGLFEENVLPPQPETSNVTLQVPLCYDVHQHSHGGNNSASGGASCSDTTDTESRSSNSGTSFGIR
ncbi:Golgi-associated plant pathogenesis-related protein 1-like [Chrysoperla carnea]|uniref:Golgi-associated plant pathogenesis-related protein 1-like n=1 Tax=Chrysoperla carnea TaxID=189513 RepID=UPI001D08E22F|nr:Golgi-associated plant pathogenesis-related protein 1-like [Chrysoperla carnea]